MRRVRLSSAFFAALAALALARPVHCQTVAVAAGVGQLDVLNKGNGVEGTWELRLAPRRFRFQPRRLPALAPIAGVVATSQGTLYAYAGLRLELPLSTRWALAPSCAAGLYYRGAGAGKDLGSPLEFRSGLELSRRVNEKTRLGLTLYHISNSRLERTNPGSESLVLSVSQRLAR